MLGGRRKVRRNRRLSSNQHVARAPQVQRAGKDAVRIAPAYRIDQGRLRDGRRIGRRTGHRHALPPDRFDRGGQPLDGRRFSGIRGKRDPRPGAGKLDRLSCTSAFGVAEPQRRAVRWRWPADRQRWRAAQLPTRLSDGIRPREVGRLLNRGNAAVQIGIGTGSTVSRNSLQLPDQCTDRERCAQGRGRQQPPPRAISAGYRRPPGWRRGSPLPGQSTTGRQGSWPPCRPRNALPSAFPDQIGLQTNSWRSSSRRRRGHRAPAQGRLMHPRTPRNGASADVRRDVVDEPTADAIDTHAVTIGGLRISVRSAVL